MSGNSRVFFELAVGDLEKQQEEEAKWTRFVEFVTSKGSAYGAEAKTADDVSKLDAEQLETLAEVCRSSGSDGCSDIRTSAPASAVLGRVVFELNKKDCPKTSENFRALCTGEKGVAPKGHKKLLSFANSTFHRIVPGKFLHGGDFTRGDGSGGDSIYNGKFNDEKPGLKFMHDQKGLLSMANSGKNSNTSQFFVTLDACPKLDGKHVVFGRVVCGMEIVELVATRCDPDAGKEMPRETITITACGEC
ncbi:unnamed protein product [Amoebophrya sp. A25]|nr:unnamed protein product [Amoebophrya sp. A25]|eukprot:GSA25T00001711001.1